MSERLQTDEDMRKAGASEEEIKQVNKLWELLHPCIRTKHNGRIEMEGGDKTLLGFYRTIASTVNFKHAQ